MLQTTTLRDLFAAHALTGILAWTPDGGTVQMDMESAAEDAYGFADAMILARQSGPGPAPAEPDHNEGETD